VTAGSAARQVPAAGADGGRGPWRPPSARERLAIIRRSRTVAIVGASPNPARASYFVATYLLSSSTDFTVWMVNPRETEILGQPAYASLADLPGRADIVDVFRRPADLPQVAAEAVAAGAATFWAQLGLHSDEAVDIAYRAGLDVVTNRCLKIEHARFAGGLHLAGFDTGVISSRRAL
jgi:predicted CoA-binding protein